MNLVEIERSVGLDGQLILPADLLGAMGITPGDTVQLAYMTESPNSACNTYKRLVLKPNGDKNQNYGEECELTLPRELLNAAEIPLDSDLNLICAKGAVVITVGDLLDTLPKELRQLFSDLDINPNIVREVMRNGEIEDEE